MDAPTRRGRQRSAVPPATKILRFGLNPHRKRDAQILQWVGGIRPYLRAEAIRSALEAYLHQAAEPSDTHSPTADARPPRTLRAQGAAGSHTTEKLKRMF